MERGESGQRQQEQGKPGADAIHGTSRDRLSTFDAGWNTNNRSNHATPERRRLFQTIMILTHFWEFRLTAGTGRQRGAYQKTGQREAAREVKRPERQLMRP
jgi:hypothetical protein